MKTELIRFAVYLWENKLAVIAAVGAIGTAAVVTMPTPDRAWWSVQTVKEWTYDFLHQFINSKNTRASAPPKEDQTIPKS